MSGIKLASAFDLSSPVPLDSRQVVEDLAARDAISAGVRYEGMTVYVKSEKKQYWLKGGVENSNFVEVADGDAMQQVTQQLDEIETKKAGKIETTVLFNQKNNADIFTPVGNVTPKLVYNSNGTIYVITQKPNGNGYLRFRMRENLVMQEASYGGLGEFFRLVEVFNVRDCYLVKYNEKATSDSSLWSTTQITDRGVLIDFRNMSSTVSVAGAWIEYEVTIPSGVYSLDTLINSGNTTSTNVNISVDGTVVQQNFSLKQATNGIHKISTPITPGKHTIRFTNNVNGGSITIAGTSIVDLKDYKRGYAFDKRIVIHTSNDPYITNGGACDYAFVDADNGLYCGSYHGGETRKRLLHIVDGTAIPLNDGEFSVGYVYELEQDTLIAGKLNSYTRQIFKLDGSRELEMTFEGSINVTSFNTNMSTTTDTFQDILYPKRLKVGANGQWSLPVDCNYVVQRNATNNQKAITIFNNVTLNENPTVPFVLTSSGYSKLYKRNYYSSTPIQFTGGFFRTIHIFE